MEAKKNNQCQECKKLFSGYNVLRKHIKKFHAEKLEVLAPLAKSQKKFAFTCNLCNKNFNQKRNLTFHMKTHQHQEVTKPKTLNSSNCTSRLKTCPLCDFACWFKKDMHKHFLILHNIEMNVQKFTFESVDEFMTWKADYERKMDVKFIRKRGLKSTCSKTVYYCFRSGFFMSKSKGLRHLKTQGSCKIDGHCPAEISLVYDANKGKHIAELISNHVGHQKDIGHLTLTDADKKDLASKIVAKIPLSVILDEVWESTCHSLERKHLITRKDLNNIVHKYNLQSEALRHKNDVISVQSWVQEMQEKSSSILFYKAQGGSGEDIYRLRKEDFLLIIMTEGQEHMLKKYGHDCVCLDGTHSLNNYNFELHSLVVLDNLRQGFPCAFCISNRSDEAVLKLFFSKIKERIGLVSPKVFMSDMAEAYYNAWSQVMSVPQFRLYCTWHVDKAWRKKLSLINSQEKKVIIYKQVRTLLQETDPVAFNMMMDQFINININDPEAASFVCYFRDNYVEKASCWAFSHRLHSGLNMNMHIENLYRTIKHIYSNGKKVQRLDKAIHALMKMVRDKLFDQIIVLNKGKVSSKLSLIGQRHKSSTSLNLSITKRQEYVWEVSSAAKPFMYLIEENQIECDCLLICQECKTCIHKYSCSCIDSTIKFNMCKHIHYLCKTLKNQPQISESSSKKNSEETVEEKKRKADNIFQRALASITTDEEIDALLDIVSSIDATLTAIRKS